MSIYFFAFKVDLSFLLIAAETEGFRARVSPRGIDLLVETAASDKHEYVEDRRIEIEVLDDEIPQRSLSCFRLGEISDS